MEYELYHYGILGMHWGIRRYQNKDGSLTSAGRAHYKNTPKEKIGKRATDAARISDKIKKLESKDYSKKREDKISKLKTAYKGLTSEMNSKEIKLGEDLIKLRKGVIGAYIGGSFLTLVGGPAVAIGYYAFSEKGRQYRKDYRDYILHH